MDEYVFEMNNISKEFPGVKALDGVTFRVKKGEIHALVGENGAGKSTLMKILSGLYPVGTFTGKIIIKGEEKKFHNTRESEHSGIAVIYQELALVRQLSVAENIFLGNEIQRHGIINWNEVNNLASKWLSEVGLIIDPRELIRDLGVGKQQLIEIAKALSKKATILVLDEPTAALNETDSKNLLDILRKLKSDGVTCIYISHKLEEVMNIADSVTVLRDGRTIHSQAMQDEGGMTEAKMINFMVGRALEQRYPREQHTAGSTIMEVKNWNVWHHEFENRQIIHDINFEVRQGEILGIAGLMGSGRTELCMSLFGAYGSKVNGSVTLDGKLLEKGSPLKAINMGLSYLSEDRKGNGLVLGMDIKSNSSLAALNKVFKKKSDSSSLKNFGIINTLREITLTETYTKKLGVKTPSIEQKVGNLSGGNQQKVVLAKWLLSQPKVLILDEPTRGIDVGAKFEIYNIMNNLIKEGVAIIMVSSELPEILGMSDRILVMHEGSFKGELAWQDATQEKCMHLATGGR